MTNRTIRAIQSANSKKLAEDGLPLIRQSNFPKPTQPRVKVWRCEREMARRLAQISRGYLTESNGLVR